MVKIFESGFLYEVEIMKSKLLSEGIESYIKNEYVNNVAVMPVNQNYILMVDESNADQAREILDRIEE
ncbi:DUF2007 domain-containing protein [Riemerella anatipestifer]|uniref:DUF2007 domain-containing protein n=1 Tax=Riemerella anatipestifer (strain ATCC 11845 / DSM 15868 / JCM 9532 / NCTC 11014) TaxID=693978 RepID=E4T915_RIEAD|nr:DUF2007 domain-containing protein [Riemerella anatipestifer]ADQ81496.1 hypothetical protein Riean_0326 [Riemerella anatipestifer ATCC 11845 = DSM 15868]ADZ13010.1 hypothetical protein RIA_1958 [Riemerella anatipestifer RA-GD]AFD55513.1 hypothetical protein RA0C_0536 [Riemerella anatipestifer ATCC 11845 = DSM 15868]AGC40606.1 hypothetical protein G148_1302 [Riemerella anatipestifer RA-CH-2]AKP68769.1 hypothetical protein CG08_0353 [Riemerella anatipestifer]